MSDAHGTATRTLVYQPALDGLRAVAVLAVILYHEGYGWARGGFLGVDAFFVLSGYLITSLLLSEYARDHGIALVAFWGRRARRLLPALLLVLLAIALYAKADVSPFELARLRGDALSSLFYVTNWRFIASHDSYFSLYSTPSPLRHLWSLAIEEQFYLVWPLVALACLRLRRGRHTLLAAVAAAGTIASATIMAVQYRAADSSRSYYGTDARAHTILVGALLALALARPEARPVRGGRLAASTGTVGALTIVWAMHSLSGQSGAYYHGLSLAYAVAVAAVIALAVQPRRSIVRSALATRPLVAIGRISYGLYLWHWPVQIWMTDTRAGVHGVALDGARIATTFALAIASYHLVEMPIRQGRVPRLALRPLVPASIAATGVAIVTATAGAAALPSYLGGGVATATRQGLAFTAAPTRSHQPSLPVTPKPQRIEGGGAQTNIEIYPCPPPSDSEAAEARRAAERAGPLPVAIPSRPIRVLVVGDSVGCSVAVGLGPAGGRALDVEQVTTLGCGVVSDQIWDSSEPFPAGTEGCHAVVTQRELAALARFRPDVVLWVSTWERFNLVDHGVLLETGTPAWRTELRRRLDAAYALLTSGGAHLLVTTIAATAPTNLLPTVRAEFAHFDWQFPIMDDELAAFVARHPARASLVDVARRLCPDGPPCPEHVDGITPRKLDGAHFDPAGAVWISRWMLPQIVAAASHATD